MWFLFGIGIYVIAIAFLASWVVSAVNLDQDQLARSDLKEDYVDIPIVCPYPEKNASNLPHEYDCTKFYKCDVGQGVLQDCPKMIKGDPVTRLHYNRLLQVCDWPWQAGCETCPPINADGTYPPPSKINHESDTCNLYYECINGIPYLRSCTGGQCFSRTCQECVWNRGGGKCNGWPIPTTPTTPTIPTRPPPGDCQNPPGETGDTIPHDCNCARYYTCLRPNWLNTNCPDGLHFSPTRRTCLPPNEAGCLLPNK